MYASVVIAVRTMGLEFQTSADSRGGIGQDPRAEMTIGEYKRAL